MTKTFVRWREAELGRGRGLPGRTGLTLVELLVILAVVGGLLSLLVPAVFGALQAARRAACQSNLRNIGVAKAMYRETLRGSPPGDVWAVELLPFLQAKELHKAWKRNPKAPLPRPAVFVCPSAGQLDSVKAGIPAAHYVNGGQDAPQGCRLPWFPGPRLQQQKGMGPHSGLYNVLYSDGKVTTCP